MTPSSADLIPLFREFPSLVATLPRVVLGEFPSPVEAVDLGRDLGLGSLWIKRDDRCGLEYGSNKIRKLEFLLAEAQARGAREVFTFGFAGSNHALATALGARRLGLTCTALLMPQAGARYVRQNLLAGLGAGARLVPCRNILSAGLRAWRLQRRGAFAIPAGGTCALGIVAYVNAAFELKDQIREGLLPEPDRIYVPLGSMGTAAGLSLGLQAAGLSTRIEAVRVIERRWAPTRALADRLREALALLRQRDPSFPALSALGSNLRIRDEFLGPGYARFTPEGREASARMKEATGIELVGTYSAKAFGALLADARRGELKGQRVLFWNTYNSRDLGPLLAGRDPGELPRAFRRYFEEPSQD